jgi:hypothetical protein
MEKDLKQMLSHANYGKSAMETGDHSKNGASPKSLTSRGNFLQKSIFKSLACPAAFMWLAGVAQTYAQQNGGKELRRHIRYVKTASDCSAGYILLNDKSYKRLFLTIK